MNMKIKRWIISGRYVSIVDNIYYLLCANVLASLILRDLETCRLAVETWLLQALFGTKVNGIYLLEILLKE